MEIQKIRLLYLQYILQQSDDSSINKFFKLQLEFPTRGDWASRIIKDLEELEIKESLEEIKLMSKNKFNQILKNKLRVNALKYLTNKQGTKGKDIQYSTIEMSEYLLPSNKNLTLEEKRRQFAIRNKMVDIPANFPKTKEETICFCGKVENMNHIYECEMLENEKERVSYDKIYSGDINEQTEVFRRMEKCLEKREILQELDNELPCDPYVIRCDSSFG